MNFKQYIEINPEKHFGKPTIKGTRISVAEVLNWLANGMSREEIIQDFPELSDEQINACLFFAASKEGHLGIAKSATSTGTGNLFGVDGASVDFEQIRITTSCDDF